MPENKNFQIWLLIPWQLDYKPIGRIIHDSLINIEVFPTKHVPISLCFYAAQRGV